MLLQIELKLHFRACAMSSLSASKLACPFLSISEFRVLHGIAHFWLASVRSLPVPMYMDMYMLLLLTVVCFAI